MGLVEMYARPFLLAVLCFLIYSFSAVIYKIQLTIQGISYFLFCNDKAWTKQSDPQLIFEPLTKTPEGQSRIEKKTVIFVRHGESTWNDTFNKGSHRSAIVFVIGFIPGLIKSFSYEFYLLITGKIDSWFYDSPLSYLGLGQVKTLSKFLSKDPSQDMSLSEEERNLISIMRSDPKAPPSKLVSSSLRRALSTVAAGFQERLQRNQSEKIVVLPSLQEISRNPDTLSITPPNTQVTPSWVDLSSKDCDFASIFATQVDMTYHIGNKPIDTNGLKRMNEFCHIAFSGVIPEEYIIVGGHSIWFRSFFREYLPYDSEFIGKKKKVVNCGAVAFDLLKTTSEDGGGERYMVDENSVRVVYGGFK